MRIVLYKPTVFLMKRLRTIYEKHGHTVTIGTKNYINQQCADADVLIAFDALDVPDVDIKVIVYDCDAKLISNKDLTLSYINNNIAVYGPYVIMHSNITSLFHPYFHTLKERHYVPTKRYANVAAIQMGKCDWHTNNELYDSVDYSFFESQHTAFKYRSKGYNGYFKKPSNIKLLKVLLLQINTVALSTTSCIDETLAMAIESMTVPILYTHDNVTNTIYYPYMNMPLTRLSKLNYVDRYDMFNNIHTWALKNMSPQHWLDILEE